MKLGGGSKQTAGTTETPSECSVAFASADIVSSGPGDHDGIDSAGMAMVLFASSVEAYLDHG